ncbi:hypothetical protein F5148DRAFT_584264 [Russula earlei]|uniref:Uncharacterized protein n=1 Tax=Russula earlei TaxID=71964 RepID=A0ACC0UI08_9AGAM|nr:hypothetical protein F5148DRAFT_584264 [Russula earlei]
MREVVVVAVDGDEGWESWQTEATEKRVRVVARWQWTWRWKMRGQLARGWHLSSCGGGGGVVSIAGGGGTRGRWRTSGWGERWRTALRLANTCCSRRARECEVSVQKRDVSGSLAITSRPRRRGLRHCRWWQHTWMRRMCGQGCDGRGGAVRRGACVGGFSCGASEAATPSATACC